MVYGFFIILDLHLNWVVLQVDAHNALNFLSQRTTFQELQSFTGTLDQFFPFVQQFYGCASPLYFLQVILRRDFIVILSKSNTQWGVPLGGMLFILTHFRILPPTTTTHFTCVFSPLTNDTHIIDHVSNVVLAFSHFQAKFATLKLSKFSQQNVLFGLQKDQTYPYHFHHTFLHLLHMFLYYTCTNEFYAICGILIAQAFQNDLNTIISFIMLANPHVIFALLLFCYAQHLSYLLHIVFLSLCIL